jgi:hypothetical protein
MQTSLRHKAVFAVLVASMLNAHGFAVNVDTPHRSVFVNLEKGRVEPTYEVAVVMGKLPTVSANLDDSQISRLSGMIAPSFRTYMGYFLKDEYLPSEDYVRANIRLFNDVECDVSSEQHIADLAFLGFRVDNRDFLIAEAGFMTGLISISMSLANNEAPGSVADKEVQNVADRVPKEYLKDDPRAPFEVNLKESSALKGVLLLGSKETMQKSRIENYRQKLVGLYTNDGLCLIFSKHPSYPTGNPGETTVDPPLPSRLPPLDKWFEFLLGAK